MAVSVRHKTYDLATDPARGRVRARVVALLGLGLILFNVGAATLLGATARRIRRCSMALPATGLSCASAWARSPATGRAIRRLRGMATGRCVRSACRSCRQTFSRPTTRSSTSRRSASRRPSFQGKSALASFPRAGPARFRRARRLQPDASGVIAVRFRLRHTAALAHPTDKSGCPVRRPSPSCIDNAAPDRSNARPRAPAARERGDNPPPFWPTSPQPTSMRSQTGQQSRTTGAGSQTALGRRARTPYGGDCSSMTSFLLRGDRKWTPDFFFCLNSRRAKPSPARRARADDGDIPPPARQCKSDGSRPGGVLFSEGDAASEIHELAQGAALISRRLPDGRRQIVDIIGPGRLFGFTATDRHDCSAAALSSVGRVQPRSPRRATSSSDRRADRARRGHRNPSVAGLGASARLQDRARAGELLCRSHRRRRGRHSEFSCRSRGRRWRSISA